MIIEIFVFLMIYRHLKIPKMEKYTKFISKNTKVVISNY